MGQTITMRSVCWASSYTRPTKLYWLMVALNWNIPILAARLQMESDRAILFTYSPTSGQFESTICYTSGTLEIRSCVLKDAAAVIKWSCTEYSNCCWRFNCWSDRKLRSIAHLLSQNGHIRTKPVLIDHLANGSCINCQQLMARCESTRAFLFKTRRTLKRRFNRIDLRKRWFFEFKSNWNLNFL